LATGRKLQGATRCSAADQQARTPRQRAATCVGELRHTLASEIFAPYETFPLESVAAAANLCAATSIMAARIRARPLLEPLCLRHRRRHFRALNAAASVRRRRLVDRRGVPGALRCLPREALWRSSRARNLRAHCNGHANTLPSILDTEGDIFGGFTRAEWELPEPIGMGRGRIPVDPRRKRFFLTLKNPCNFPMRNLLKTGEKN
jgi:hypothetical protein